MSVLFACIEIIVPRSRAASPGAFVVADSLSCDALFVSTFVLFEAFCSDCVRGNASISVNILCLLVGKRVRYLLVKNS